MSSDISEITKNAAQAILEAFSVPNNTPPDEIIQFYKYKVGRTVRFYKHFPERGFAVCVHVDKEQINRISTSTLVSTLGLKRSKSKIRPVWSNVAVYVVTNTTEKLFNYHFDRVIESLRS